MGQSVCSWSAGGKIKHRDTVIMWSIKTENSSVSNAINCNKKHI